MRTMKNSGIEWVGQIPQEWEIQRGKYVFSVLSGFAFSSSDFSTHEGIPLIRIRDITSGETETFYKGVYSDEFLVNNGDLLIGMDGDFGIRIWDNGLALLNQRCCKIIAKEKSFLNFLYYVLPYELKQINDLAFFTTVKHLSSEDLALVNIPLPSEDEQLQIVDYLDTKCTQIDALIEAKEKTNALLRERRQSIIYEAVTKGLNPDAPKKDSDIEWIGQIPEHWETIRAKYVMAITNGTDPKTEGDVPVYGSGSGYFKTCGEYKEGPTVLLGRKGTIDIPQYITGKYWNVDTAFDVNPKNDQVNLEFYYFASTCFDYKYYTATTTLPSMTQTNYGNMFIPFPPAEEQRHIVVRLKEKLDNIDILISSNDATVQKLKEYRQSIIYEAVTGKVEV